MIDLEAAILEARKSRNAVALQAYQALKTKALVKQKEAGRTAGQPLAEEELVALVRREVKERAEANEFLAPDHPEHALNREIIAVLERHLPAQLSEAESEALIRRVVAECGATGPREMGKVMAALRQSGANLDMARASARVKELLAEGGG